MKLVLRRALKPERIYEWTQSMRMAYATYHQSYWHLRKSRTIQQFRKDWRARFDSKLDACYCMDANVPYVPPTPAYERVITTPQGDGTTFTMRVLKDRRPQQTGVRIVLNWGYDSFLRGELPNLSQEPIMSSE